MNRHDQEGMNPPTNFLYCSQCGRQYKLEEIRWKCQCGSFLDISFHHLLDIHEVEKRESTLWRYREAIPLADEKKIISLGEGWTPLIPIPIQNRTVFFKQDHLSPSGSFKDRGATVLISKASELGVREVIEDSSGNAGAAIAAYCARGEIGCHVFVPSKASQSKIGQIVSHGARITLVPGPRENASQAALQEARNVYFASHVWNPFFLEGTKTISFEISEQLGWATPDVLVFPVGNGTLLLGAYKGFKELSKMGVTTKIPRLIAVQPENCAPIYHSFKQKKKVLVPIKAKRTLAEGLSISKPLRGLQIIEAIRESDGDVVVVSEDEIKNSLKDMLEKGFYIEPSSAVTVAGLRKTLGQIGKGDLVVSVLTGHGLKGIPCKKPAG